MLLLLTLLNLAPPVNNRNAADIVSAEMMVTSQRRDYSEQKTKDAGGFSISIRAAAAAESSASQSNLVR